MTQTTNFVAKQSGNEIMQQLRDDTCDEGLIDEQMATFSFLTEKNFFAGKYLQILVFVLQ